MATKIENRKLRGWVDDRTAHGPVTSMEWTKLFFRPIPTASLPATLIIHDGPPERVYTESEVRALLKEVGSQKGIWIVDVQRVAERHGLASPSNPL